MNGLHKTIGISYKNIWSIAAARSPARVPVLPLLGLVTAGFLLRVLCARGDLWLDEIWSLQNLEKIQNIGGIFWGISQDNNHFLNSLWLWFVGPHAPPVLMRLESIICGALTIPVAARLCGRAGIIAGLAGATLTAGSVIFVEYGSEARGYAGLLLMIFIAAEALEIFLDSTPCRNTAAPRINTQSRIAFCIAVGLGALFHLTMLAAAVSLIFATVLRLLARGSARPIVFQAAFDLSVSAILGAAPALGFVAAGILNTHQIVLGRQVSFSFGHLMEGLATLTDATLGLPFGTPPWIVLVIALVGIGLAALITPRDRFILPLTVLFLPPIGAAILHMPSVQIARFHLIGTLGLVLFASYAFQWLLTLRKPACLLAGIAIALGMIGGNAFHLRQLLVQGRGHYRKVVLFMENHQHEPRGPATYASNMPAEVGRTVHFYDVGHGNLRLVVAPNWCTPPDWYILSDDPAGETSTRIFGSPKCTVTYRQEMRTVPAPLSGLRWVLYQRSS